MAEVRVSGSVTIVEDVKRGEQVALLILGTVRAEEDVLTATAGEKHIVKVRMDSAIVAQGEESEDLQERLLAVREERDALKRGATGQLVDGPDDEYTGLSHADARQLCKDRGLNAKGNRLELISRLRDNG